MHLELELLEFYGGRIRMRKITIKSPRRVENVDRIIENLESRSNEEEGRNYLEENENIDEGKENEESV